jgi:hypothetical protein
MFLIKILKNISYNITYTICTLKDKYNNNSVRNTEHAFRAENGPKLTVNDVR